MADAERIPQWTLGERLRKARLWANVGLEQLAADIGRTPRTIRNYESDATTAPLLVLKRYALRTKVPVKWITTGDAPGPDDDDPDASTNWLSGTRSIELRVAASDDRPPAADTTP